MLIMGKGTNIHFGDVLDFQTTFVIFHHLLDHNVPNHIAPITPNRKHAQNPENISLDMDS